MLQYTLMHKNVPVAELSIDEDTGYVSSVDELSNAAHFPISAYLRENANVAALNEWWSRRSIPASRAGLEVLLGKLGIDTPQNLSRRCLGLSLSDQYWVRPHGSDVSWYKINFFNNDFSEDIGDILFGQDTPSRNLLSPDSTSDGYLMKRWKIIGGVRCLIKAGSSPFFQEPYNEVAASIIAARLNIPHVTYHLMKNDGTAFSVCDNFITDDTELIPANDIIKATKRSNNHSAYQHYIYCCESLGITDIVHSVNQMIVLDFLTMNEDRHYNNFGLIRDANTLKWLGAAPIYDTGSSMGYNKTALQIRRKDGVICKPFKNTHNEQLRLVTSFDWLDLSKLNGLRDELSEVYAQGVDEIGADRVSSILDMFDNQIRLLAAFVEQRSVAVKTSVPTPDDELEL